MLLKPVWTDEQIEEIHARALDIYERLTDPRDIGPVVGANVYQGILNMCGQVEAPRVQPAAQLPRRDTIKER